MAEFMAEYEAEIKIREEIAGQQRAKPCCAQWAAAFEMGSDNEGYQQLIRFPWPLNPKHLQFVIGTDLSPIRFCPWCGAPK